MNKTETIAAISTAMNNSGIGIVRISGNDALTIIDKIFKPINNNKKMTQVKTHTIHYGNIIDDNNIVDEVLVLIMKAPHTYTKEDTVEIDCHGGVLVVKKILELVIRNGARSAEPGEFTKRAFLNGRIDLSQAEAVIDLINAQNEFALDSSIKQLKGNVSEKINEVRAKLINQIAFIESALDDPEHINVDGYGKELSPIIKDMQIELEQLIESADNGRILQEGIKTVILGKPNVGKSSLLNLLVGEERAIVTEIAGTTRDTVEERIRINEISLNIVDTAGIRNTEDIIEKIGVSKALNYAKDADLIVYVVDGSKDLEQDDYKIIELIKEKKAIVLLNKIDLEMLISKQQMEKLTNKNVILISAKNNVGINEFYSTVKELFYNGQIKFNDQIVITNIRHKEAINQAFESLKLVEQSINDEMPEDFLSIDLMNAYIALGIVIGEAIEDDLVNEIFSKFCTGK